LSYAKKKEEIIYDGPVEWQSLNAGTTLIPGFWRFFRHASQYANSVDIIWACSDSIYGIIGHMLSAKYSIPLVFDLYDNFEFFLAARLPVIKQLYHRTVKKCSAVTCASQPLAELVGTYGRKENIVVLENAVRTDLFYPMPMKSCRSELGFPQDCRLIGTAGALENNRGLETLFAAFEMLKKRFPDLHLALAGPRNINLPRGERIHDLGVMALEKVPVLLNSLDVAVICNRDNLFGRYCFPQKATEIMACDVPLIAARVGSMAALFKDYPKWLFTPDDSHDLADAIEHRLSDRTTAYRFATSWKDASEKLEKTFNDVLTQNR
jgi:glycosyltransferase involved in cell wall biosynthesis